MQYHVNHEIGVKAEGIFTEQLAKWAINSFKRDYGKDFHVEIVDQKRELTGKAFIVQLKGTEALSVNRPKSRTTFRLAQNHATYYADIVTQPVFLFLVDVKRRKGFWIYLQENLRKFKGLRWRNQETITIRIPLTNRLSDLALLQAAVEDSLRDMAAHRPTSIVEAIEAHQSKYERLDPRFRVKVKAKEDSTELVIDPKTDDIRLVLRAMGEPTDFQQKLDDFFSRGKTITFTSGKFEILGSDLFTTLVQEGVSITFSRTIKLPMAFVARTADGLIASRLDAIPVKVKGGAKQCSYSGALHGSPVSFTLLVDEGATEGRMNFSFKMRPWASQPILSLKYFDQICEFFEGVAKADHIDLECFLNGTKHIISSTGKEHLPLFRRMAEVMTVLRKTREVCRLLNIQPLLVGKFGGSETMQIIELHEILTKGERRTSRKGYRYTYSVERQPFLDALPETGEARIGDSLVKTWGSDAKTTILETEVPIGGLQEELVHLRLTESVEQLRKRAMESQDDKMEIEMVGVEDSEQILRMVKLP